MEKNIDGAYAYLNGSPEFKLQVDLAGRNKMAQTILKKVFKSKIDSLPLCKSSIQGSLDNFDLFSATCWPQNIPKVEAYAMVDKFISKLSLLDQNALNSKSSNLKPNEHTERIQKAFHYWPYVLLVLLIVIIKLTVLIYLLIPNKRAKLFALGSIFGTSGCLVFFMGIFTRFNSSFLLKQISNQIPPENVEFLDTAKPIITTIWNDLAGSFISWSLIVLVLVMVFFILFNRKKSSLTN